MKYLGDTNVLLRRIEKSHPSNRFVSHALMKLVNNGSSLYVTMQNISEFWNVCTRPVANNGLGLTLEATARHLKRIERLFVRLPDSENHYAVWRDLVFRERVLGVRVHDAKLVALMMLYDIDKILTFNTRDFARYPKIEPVSPLDV